MCATKPCRSGFLAARWTAGIADDNCGTTIDYHADCGLYGDAERGEGEEHLQTETKCEKRNKCEGEENAKKNEMQLRMKEMLNFGIFVTGVTHVFFP